MLSNVIFFDEWSKPGPIFLYGLDPDTALTIFCSVMYLCLNRENLNKKHHITHIIPFSGTLKTLYKLAI